MHKVVQRTRILQPIRTQVKLQLLNVEYKLEWQRYCESFFNTKFSLLCLQTYDEKKDEFFLN